jgi:apolipoprotein D and lipocalin family protein
MKSRSKTFVACQKPAVLTRFGVSRWLGAVALAACLAGGVVLAQPVAGGAPSPAAAAPLASLPALDVSRYMGTWYQVALFPNRFQAQCVSDTTATYRLLPGGQVEVLNRCRTASGQLDDALGVARPVGVIQDGQLQPARLQVSFLPSWLRWTGVGWGDYWVVQLATDYRYVVVSEPSRRFLWILSRTARLSAEDDAAIRKRLLEQGFDLAGLQPHPHGSAP